MKLIGWAIALAAAGLTPAAAQAPQAAAPAAETAQAAPAAVDHSAHAMPAAQVTPPTPGLGVPVGGKGIQEQVTGIGQEAAGFHNNWLLVLCAVISLFVLGLLGYAIVRYRRGAHPVPSRNSHNTVLEVVWTLVPVLILVAIAIPSIRLLRHQYSPPKADLTVKVIGNQWYWTYQYPDNGDIEIVSNMLKEKGDVPAGQRYRTDADGPPLLAVDERLVIPAGKVVKFIITSNDVIHAFWVPAFWNKIDANPGLQRAIARDHSRHRERKRRKGDQKPRPGAEFGARRTAAVDGHGRDLRAETGDRGDRGPAGVVQLVVQARVGGRRGPVEDPERHRDQHEPGRAGGHRTGRQAQRADRERRRGGRGAAPARAPAAHRDGRGDQQEQQRHGRRGDARRGGQHRQVLVERAGARRRHHQRQ
jgi:cytochrome c oxidase subunit 2